MKPGASETTSAETTKPMLTADEGVVLLTNVEWLVAIVRMTTLILLGIDGALLLRAFYVHRPTWILWPLPWGIVTVFVGVALVQGRLLEGHDAGLLRLGSVLHIVGLMMILVGLLRSPLSVGLFKRSR